MDDFYALLGVKEDASVSEIKGAYCQAAARLHPNHTHASRSEAPREFAALARAYWVLTDDAARGDYDARRHGATNFRTTHSWVSEHIDPHQVFVGSMVELAIELIGQGQSWQTVQDTLLSKQCPEPIVQAIVATLPTSTPSYPAAANTGNNPSGTGISGNPGLTQGKTSGPPLRGKLPSGAVAAAAVVGLVTVLVIFSPQKQTNGSKAGPSEQARTSETASRSAKPGAQSYPAVISTLPAFQHFDSSTGLGTRSSSSFKLPGGEILSTTKPGSFRTEVSLRQPLPGSQRVLYLFKSAPVQSGKYDCHACSVVMSAVVTTQSADGIEKVTSPMQDLGLMGAWGDYDVSNLALVEVGKNRPGLAFRESWLAQGYSGSSVEVFGIEPKGLKKLGRFVTSGDSSASAECEQNRRTCEKYEVELRFLKDARSAYYPVELKQSGMKKDSTGDVLPTHDRYIARYNGKSYIATRVPEKEEEDTTEAATDGERK